MAALRQALDLEDQVLLRLRIDRGLSREERAAALAGDGEAPPANSVEQRIARTEALATAPFEEGGRGTAEPWCAARRP